MVKIAIVGGYETDVVSVTSNEFFLACSGVQGEHTSQMGDALMYSHSSASLKTVCW